MGLFILHCAIFAISAKIDGRDRDEEQLCILGMLFQACLRADQAET